MLRRYKKIISLILLVFLCVFNLALPLPAQAGKRGTCSMRCQCGTAMKSCCCCNKHRHAKSRDTRPCIKPLGCMDDDVEGVICHGLTHITLTEGETDPSIFLSKNFHKLSCSIHKSPVYFKAMEKPPRSS